MGSALYRSPYGITPYAGLGLGCTVIWPKPAVGSDKPGRPLARAPRSPAPGGRCCYAAGPAAHLRPGAARTYPVRWAHGKGAQLPLCPERGPLPGHELASAGVGPLLVAPLVLSPPQHLCEAGLPRGPRHGLLAQSGERVRQTHATVGLAASHRLPEVDIGRPVAAELGHQVVGLDDALRALQDRAAVDAELLAQRVLDGGSRLSRCDGAVDRERIDDDGVDAGLDAVELRLDLGQPDAHVRDVLADLIPVVVVCHGANSRGNGRGAEQAPHPGDYQGRSSSADAMADFFGATGAAGCSGAAAACGRAGQALSLTCWSSMCCSALMTVGSAAAK